MAQANIDTKQVNAYQPYNSAECTYGRCTLANPSRAYIPCEAGDAAFTRVTCGIGPLGGNNCHSQFRCTKMDPAVCPVREAVIDQRFLRDYTSNNQLFNGDPVNTRCTYDVTKITTASQIQELRRGIQGNAEINNVINREIMPTFCSLPSNSCPNGGTCSRFTSTDEEGSLCRAWASSVGPLADTAKLAYCANNPNAEECKCINRASDPDYIKLGLRSLGQDQCWFLPCRNAERYLVPSNLQQPVQCPNVCQQIYDIVAENYGTVNLQNLQNTINCDFSGIRPPVTPTNPTTPTIPTTPEVPVTPTNPTTPSTGTSWIIWVIAGIVVILIIVVIVVLISTQGK